MTEQQNRPSFAAEGSKYLGVGLTWALSTALFLYLGTAVDERLGTAPWLSLVGAFVGAAAGFWEHELHTWSSSHASASRNGSVKQRTMGSDAAGGPPRLWLLYACVTAVVCTVGGEQAPGGTFLEGENLRAFRVAAGLAYGLQLLAFAAPAALRDAGSLFMVGWGGGMLLRFAAVGILAVWLQRTEALPAPAALVSLVASCSCSA